MSWSQAAELWLRGLPRFRRFYCPLEYCLCSHPGWALQRATRGPPASPCTPAPGSHGHLRGTRGGGSELPWDRAKGACRLASKEGCQEEEVFLLGPWEKAGVEECLWEGGLEAGASDS